MSDAVFERTAANRRLLADFFDSLDEDQLARQSLCGAWTVREVLGHLVMPMTVGVGALLVETVKQRGSLHRALARIARDVARRDVTELTGHLRDRADLQMKAPGIGPMGQFVDGCIHLRDCARPLGLDTDVPRSDWAMVLDWLPTKQAGRGVVPAGLLHGLGLQATDQDWSWGTGVLVSGPSEALAMAISGRAAAIADLTGPGVAVLTGRLT